MRNTIVTIAALLCVIFPASALDQPDVILLSVDTLRADYLGCYGYDYATSPYLDAFAEQGLLFEDCVAEVPLTAPSFASMHTSRYPRTVGMSRNGLRLPEAVPTVADIFRKAGYQTACVQSNWTLKADLSGIHRGFDEYDDGFDRKRWGVLKSERYGDKVTEHALKIFEKRDPDKPLFFWIHYSDPHAPYRFHKKFNPGGRAVHRLEKPENTRTEYASEVAFTDDQIRQVLAKVDLDETFVLFVADHGESLYEHDYIGHGRRIYQTGVHIPLVLRGPGIEPGCSPYPARGIDVGTTLLAMAGLEPAKGMLGENLLVAPREQVERIRVIETYGGAVPKLPGARELMADRPAMRQGVFAGEWKLITRGPRTELYNLIQDPTEENNLAGDEPNRVAELQKHIDAWDEATPRLIIEEDKMTEEDVKALEALGYIE
jgi:arylsulfatase A-like enzyme